MTIKDNDNSYMPSMSLFRRDEWTNISFGKEYKLSVGLLGNNILLTEASGYITIDDIVFAADMLNSIINEYFISPTPYVHIDNLSKVRGCSLKARKFLISYYKEKPEHFVGLIFHSASPMLKFSALLAKKLNFINFVFEITKGYPEAVWLALELLDNSKSFAKSKISSNSPPKLHVSINSQANENYFTLLTSPKMQREFCNYSLPNHNHIIKIIDFIEKIDWSKDGIDYSRFDYDDGDPLLPVYETIAILKSEIDNLLLENIEAYRKLREQENKIYQKAKALEETNAALNVVIKSMQSREYDIHERITTNIKHLVLPYLEKIKFTTENNVKNTLIDIVESNLNKITSNYTHKLSSSKYGLSSTEIKVANLIRIGKTTKEIAAILFISYKTVESHREKIRKKIRISNKKINLRSYLLSMPK